jgi:hypothetical protein
VRKLARPPAGNQRKVVAAAILGEEVHMFGSQILEAVIGLTLVYLVLSIGCSGIKEIIASLFSLRSKTLEEGIRNMLKNGDRDLTAELFQHPLIARTARPGDKPSYISSRFFAVALLDILAPPVGAQPRTMQDFRDGVSKLPDDKLRKTLTGMLDSAQGNVDAAREKIEHWFDGTMDRVSGWYKRTAQTIIFAVGLVLCVALNADSLLIVRELWSDEALRRVVIAQAEKKVQSANPADAGTANASLAQVAGEIRQANTPPIGWNPAAGDIRALPDSALGWILKVLGILLTSFAILLGAPFWFDVLNKIINLRLSGDPPKTTT